MKRHFISVLAACAVIDKCEEFIKSLNDNLNTLDKSCKGEVTINLTISDAQYKFVKVLGKWGVMTCKGSWEPFEIVPIEDLRVMAERVQRVVDEK
jgi:hypothetical protein